MAPTTIDLNHIKSLSWTVDTTYTVPQIISYNLALGAAGSDLPLTFEGHPNFHALPTFGAINDIAVMGLVHRAMFDFLPDFKAHNHVHGEHYLSLKRPYPTKGAQLRTTAKVVDVVDRRSGVLVCVDITTTDASTGEEICNDEWAGFVMKVPGKGANPEQLRRGPRTTLHPPPDRKPDAVVEQKTTAEQGALYRAASGDLNPLHIDPEVAKTAGFPGPILTGTCTMGMGVRHIIDTFAGGDASRFKNVKLRLSKPVFPGETVRTEMWREDGGQRIVYRQLGGKDKVVISHAAVELKGGNIAHL